MGDGNFEVESVEILVVDDHSENLKTLSAVLNRDKYKVRLAQSGPQALRSVKTKPPNLILLDIRMPEMDGYEVCRRLKQDKISREIPIIFISALDEPMNKVKAFEVGGVDYIEKPFNSEEVIARINTHLKLLQLQKELQKHSQTLEKQVDVRTAQLVERTAELSKANQILSVIYDSVTDILFYISVEPDDCFRFLSINNAFLNATGLTRDQIVGKRIEEVIPETSVRLVLDNYKKSIKEKIIVRWKETSVYPVGEKIGDVSIAPVLNKKGICTHLVGSVHDVTENKQAEQTLREAELRYRTVADFTYDWENWTNVDDTLEYVSPSCERISGYSVQDFMENPSLFQKIIVPEDQGIWDQHVCDSKRDLTLKEVQFRIKTRDGDIRWIEHACQPVIDDRGNHQGVRASNRDITQRQFYKSETHQLQSELAHMDRIVSINALTSALAHEINQPLAAMRSYAQAALRFIDKDQPEYNSVRKALQGIVADNKRAAAVINRLRNLAKKGTMHWEPIEINSIINDVMSLINSEIILRNASITLDLHPSVPVVQGDSIQIQQVLINLLTNALDAMDDQPIDLRTITISTRFENSNGIIVSISDSGGGIPPDTFEDLFSPFHTTKSTGMGLGLSICKSIIETHGGKIWAENNPDGGAIFSLILPAGNQIK